MSSSSSSGSGGGATSNNGRERQGREAKSIILHDTEMYVFDFGGMMSI